MLISNMSSAGKKFIHWWDSKKGGPSQLSIEDLGKHLDNVADILNAHVEKLRKVGDIPLNEIDVSLDVKGDVVVVALDGAIKLIYRVP